MYFSDLRLVLFMLIPFAGLCVGMNSILAPQMPLEGVEPMGHLVDVRFQEPGFWASSRTQVSTDKAVLLVSGTVQASRGTPLEVEHRGRYNNFLCVAATPRQCFPLVD